VRAALGLRAALAALLAGGAAALAVDLADWRYVRVDLTRAGSNTLAPEVLDVIDRLPEPVVVDVFLRPLARPYDGVFLQARARLLDLLSVVHHARRGRIDVRVHDPRDFERVQERQRELRTEGMNKVVVSCGERRDELDLFGELFTVDWGRPSGDLLRYLTSQGIPDLVDPRGLDPGAPFRPATLGEFHGEEELVEALLKVSSGAAPRVCFALGHGEPTRDGAASTDLARLAAALERDGFELADWDPLREVAVPSACDVLALIGPQQPYRDATRAAVKTWVEEGGRLLAAPDLSELQEERQGGVVDLLREFGIATRPGLVCQPLVVYTGERVEGSEECAWLVIDEHGFQPGHPLTDPLRLRGRRVQFTFSPSFESVGFQSSGVTMLPLVSSPLGSWRDLPPYDFRCDAARGESRGERLTLATAQELRPERGPDGKLRQGRLVALASAFFFDNDSLDENRDFTLLAFNWLAQREYRLAVAPLQRRSSRLDFERGRAKPVLAYTLWLVLPGLCALVGLLVFWRRRS
jgi:hypothetical protein